MRANRTGNAFHHPGGGGRSAAGFTLIEVMIVIGIIAILVAMLFPVVIGATDRARQKQAVGEAFALLTAIKAYQQEYGKLPAQYNEADTNFFTNNWVVVQTLWGSNVVWKGRGQNPKERVFLNMQYNTNAMDPDGNLLDPWGIPYVIALDQDGTNGMDILFVGSYRSVDATGRRIGPTNIVLTNISISNVVVGVGSLGFTSNKVPYNTWEEVI